jgi:hypothetical protein
MIIVVSLSFSSLALLLALGKLSIGRLPQGLWFAVGFFVMWMFVVLLVSGAPLNQQFWGVFGRNNGLLNYFSLVVILIAVAVIQKRSFYNKLVDALVLTAVPATAYALVQVAGRDPISWSVMAPFATLGNVNFSSAFFGLASICAIDFSRGHRPLHHSRDWINSRPHDLFCRHGSCGILFSTNL